MHHQRISCQHPATPEVDSNDVIVGAIVDVNSSEVHEVMLSLDVQTADATEVIVADVCAVIEEANRCVLRPAGER